MAMLGRRQMGMQPSIPGPGQQANAISTIMTLLPALKHAYMGLVPGSREHKVFGRVIQDLDRLVPQMGQGTGVGTQQSVLSMLMQNLKGSPILQALGTGGGQPQAGPSTPLPGA